MHNVPQKVLDAARDQMSDCFAVEDDEAVPIADSIVLALHERGFIAWSPDDDVISQIRDAYDEALAETTGGTVNPQFLFGMRYVMCLLDMPEGISRNADQGGTRSVTRRAAHAHYVSTYCIHGNHEACRLTCKTCDAPCRCDDPECTHGTP